MLHRVALVRIDVSEETSASIITLIRIGELKTALVVTDTCHRDDGGLGSSETSTLTRARQYNIPEDGILQLCTHVTSSPYLGRA
jgi:hypothetical protein